MKNQHSIEVAKKILAIFMKFRRVPSGISSCSSANRDQCALLHLPKIISSVEKNNPVSFVLPAFPGKSPNPEKVLGHLPDHAERLSLIFLGNLCLEVRKFYVPGINIILCSDGRVFSDVVGMKENHVSDYQHEMSCLLNELSLADITLVNLDDFYSNDLTPF